MEDKFKKRLDIYMTVFRIIVMSYQATGNSEPVKFLCFLGGRKEQLLY